MASLYAFGWVMSSKLQESTQLPTPTLQIHSTLVTNLVDSTILHPTPTSNMPKSFIVPLDFLETRNQCEQWIRRNLIVSMRFVIVASETDNPDKLLTELIWSMKNAWEAGLKCSGVVEMNVMIVSTLDLRRIVVESWLKTSVSNFTEGDEEEGSRSSSCGVCLDELEEKSAVVKLRCRHVFHGQCIRDWLHRKTTCPSCRNPLDIRFKFWVHMDKQKSSFPIQLKSEVQKHLFHTSTEENAENGEKQTEPMNPVVPGFSGVKGSEHAQTEPEEEEEEYPDDGIGGSRIINEILTTIVYMKKRGSAAKKKDQSKTITRKSRKVEKAQSRTCRSKSRKILAVTIFYRARVESIREVYN